MSAFGPIEISAKAKRTTNPIRNIVDNLKPPQGHAKSFLNLGLGDPTLFGNLLAPEVLKTAVIDVINKNNGDGYLPSTGAAHARKAIATYSSREGDGNSITDDDVIIASGCSGAVEIAISVLINEGDNILVPRPGFPLYQVITESLGGNVKSYSLIAERNWECNLEEMDQLIDSRTKAILINNPSNPCGSNYSAEHLSLIVEVARKHGLPIIADEIYGGCVFDGIFTPIQVLRGNVPVIALGGLAKEFVVPGWRVGWVTLHDSKDIPRMNGVKVGMKSLSQIILGASSIIQHAIPKLLCPVKDSEDDLSLQAYYKKYLSVLQTNAQLCVTQAENCPGLSVVEPTAAMYAMVKIDIDALKDISDDCIFSQKLLQEENLLCLPGQCFGMPNFIRLVTCAPAEKITDAFERIAIFCQNHAK